MIRALYEPMLELEAIEEELSSSSSSIELELLADEESSSYMELLEGVGRSFHQPLLTHSPSVHRKYAPSAIT